MTDGDAVRALFEELGRVDAVVNVAGISRPTSFARGEEGVGQTVRLGDALATVAGVMPGCEFHRRILSNDTRLDLHEAEQDVVAAAVRLVEAHPQVTDIVLECTNMPPYRQAVAQATGRAVHDIETLLIGEWAGWRRRCGGVA